MNDDDLDSISAAIAREHGRQARERLGLAFTPSGSIVVKTRVVVGWMDRIRILLGRPVLLAVEVWVSASPRNHAAEVNVFVPTIFDFRWLRGRVAREVITVEPKSLPKE